MGVVSIRKQVIVDIVSGNRVAHVTLGTNCTFACVGAFSIKYQRSGGLPCSGLYHIFEPRGTQCL